jgi:hypothetical protein
MSMEREERSTPRRERDESGKGRRETQTQLLTVTMECAGRCCPRPQHEAVATVKATVKKEHQPPPPPSLHLPPFHLLPPPPCPHSNTFPLPLSHFDLLPPPLSFWRRTQALRKRGQSALFHRPPPSIPLPESKDARGEHSERKFLRQRPLSLRPKKPEAAVEAAQHLEASQNGN